MVKIYPKSFVGVRKTGLAFLTPDTSDKAGEKRKATVREWTSRCWGGQPRENSEYRIVNNEFLSGYKLVKSVDRWSTSNKVWRILDPRGYELEISSGNLDYILQNGILDRGNMNGAFRWGRIGAQNYLVPQGSTIDSESVDYKLKVGSIIDFSTVKIGDSVDTPSYPKAIYCGIFWELGKMFFNGDISLKLKRLHIFKVWGDTFISYATKPKILNNYGATNDTESFLKLSVLAERKSSNIASEGILFDEKPKFLKDTLRYEASKDNDNWFIGCTYSDYLIDKDGNLCKKQQGEWNRYGGSALKDVYKKCTINKNEMKIGPYENCDKSSIVGFADILIDTEDGKVVKLNR